MTARNGHAPSGTGMGVSFFGFHTFVACHVNPLTAYRLPVTTYQLPVTTCHLPLSTSLAEDEHGHGYEDEAISFPFAISHSTTLFSICALSEKRLPQWVIK